MSSKWKMLCAFVLVVGIVGAICHQRSDPHAPRFVPGAPASISPHAANTYNWLGEIPFEGDKIWIWTMGGRTNSHLYLYDLKQRAVLGEMLNCGDPVSYTRDGSRLLCTGHGSSAANLKEMIVQKLTSFAKKLGLKVRDPDRLESFWVVDLRGGRATRVGELAQIAGTGTTWHSSPNSRYAYTVPFSGLWICELETKKMTRMPRPTEVIGWWDDQHLLFNGGKRNLLLFDIPTQQSRELVSQAQIESVLAQAGLTNAPQGLGAVPVWNGQDYDFYFGPKEKVRGLEGSDAFLLKLDRSSLEFKLLYRNFDFRWGGRLDPSGTRYLYQGESGTPGRSGNGAVYLRDLVKNTEFTVVPPDNRGQYAIPRFYGDEVIYFSNRLLRRIQLDGTNDSILLKVSSK